MENVALILFLVCLGLVVCSGFFFGRILVLFEIQKSELRKRNAEFAEVLLQCESHRDEALIEKRRIERLEQEVSSLKIATSMRR